MQSHVAQHVKIIFDGKSEREKQGRLRAVLEKTIVQSDCTGFAYVPITRGHVQLEGAPPLFKESVDSFVAENGSFDTTLPSLGVLYTVYKQEQAGPLEVETNVELKDAVLYLVCKPPAAGP